MRIDVCYVSDTKYAPVAAASISSLLYTNINNNIHIHFVDTGIKEKDRVKLASFAKNNRAELSFYNGAEIIDYYKKQDVPAFMGNYATYARMGIPELINDSHIEKMLYIDCDTFVLGDLSALWEMDIKGPYRAVEDMISPCYYSSIGLPEKWAYMNAGVLFINMTEWANTFSDRRLKDLCSLIRHSRYPDQDMINLGAFQLGLDYQDVLLEPRFNVLFPWLEWGYQGMARIHPFLKDLKTDRKAIEYAIGNPVIIHLVDGIAARPWIAGSDHPYKKIWEKYLAPTGFDNPQYPDQRSIKSKMMHFLYCMAPKAVSSQIYGFRLRRKNK